MYDFVRINTTTLKKCNALLKIRVANKRPLDILEQGGVRGSLRQEEIRVLGKMGTGQRDSEQGSPRKPRESSRNHRVVQASFLICFLSSLLRFEPRDAHRISRALSLSYISDLG